MRKKRVDIILKTVLYAVLRYIPQKAETIPQRLRNRIQIWLKHSQIIGEMLRRT